MTSLNDLSDKVAASILLADPEDLQVLAKLHEDLAAIVQASSSESGLAANVAEGVGGAASKALKTIEQIMLREVDDASAALVKVCQNVTDLQQMISGDLAPTTSAAAEVKKETKPDAKPHAATEGQGEPPLRDDDLGLVTDFVNESRGHIESAEADLLKLEDHPEDVELVDSVFRAFHTIKGVAGFLNLVQVGSLAHAAETLLDMLRKGEMELSQGVLDVVLESLDNIKALVAAVDKAARERTGIPAHPGLSVLLAKLKDAAAGKFAESAKISEKAATAEAATTATAEAAASDQNQKTAKASSQGQSSGEGAVKVTTSRLDALINMVGELVIAQAMVSQDCSQLLKVNQRTARNMSHLGKITRELQDLSMAMRMVPISGVFQKMSRLVRDLARKAGKEIELKITGGETELDRNLVEAVGDPLVHMVRNAADHGIESTEDRRRAGKPTAGRIELKAYHQAGNIVVEINDDGKGLNKAKILKKAREAGLVRDGQELSEQEIFRLIFAPGLSTADKITDVSGRGVGMDVVRRNVESLRGRVDIVSTEGQGSTFSIRLPLTLAVIDGLVVKVGKERYIVPLTSIEQSLRPREKQISTVQGRGEMCMVRDSLLPVCRLHNLFKVKPRTDNLCEAILVLVQDGSRRCCLLVDELLGQQQVVIKSLGESGESVPGVSGGAILGDGTISLILDVPGLMDLVATN